MNPSVDPSAHLAALYTEAAADHGPDVANAAAGLFELTQALESATALTMRATHAKDQDGARIAAGIAAVISTAAGRIAAFLDPDDLVRAKHAASAMLALRATPHPSVPAFHLTAA